MKYLAMYCYLALDGMLVHCRDMVSAVFRWYPLKDLASAVQKVDNTIPGLKIHSGLLLVMSTVGRNFRTVTSLYWLVKILKIIWCTLNLLAEQAKTQFKKKKMLVLLKHNSVKKFFFFLVSYLCVESKINDWQTESLSRQMVILARQCALFWALVSTE